MNRPLAEMLRYNRWATLRLLERLRQLPDEYLDVSRPWMSGPVRSVLLHLVGGQQTFVLRTMSRQHEGEWTRSSEWPGWELLISEAERSANELVAIAEGLDEDQRVPLPWVGKEYTYPRSYFLVHAVTHGVEHRTEIKLALGAVGVATPDLDGWEFAAAMGYGTPVEPPDGR